MEANNIANNANTIVADRVQHNKIKSINSLYFNALNNNQKNKMQQIQNLQTVPEDEHLISKNANIKKPVIIPMSNGNNGVVHRNGIKIICDKSNKADNSNHTHPQGQEQDNSVAAKMLRMGGQELPGLVSGSCQSSNGSTTLGSSKVQQARPNTLRLTLPAEDGAHAAARCAIVNVNSPVVMAGQQQPPQPAIRSNSSFLSSDIGSPMSNSKSFPDAVSIRSLASIGMGSTDGKRMVIRKVPTSPVELLNIANPPTPPDDYDYDADSYGNFSEDPESLYLKPRRQHWANKMQFVMACVGYSVGLGNIWRFPYLCYKSGGGVFLIPYFLIMVVCGIPMLYMELAVGQFTGRGPIGALGQICPLFKGAGLASVVISFLMSTYYSVIIAYGIYYFFTSFKPQMPWEKCNHRWNTQFCWESHNNYTYSYDIKPTFSKTPSEEFYNHKVLQISTGIEDPGSLRWDLVACLLCAWIMVYFAIWKSIKSSAKVRYITATLPFLLIVVFLLRSLSLDGADKGMRYFFRPKWELLADAKVWVNAAAQIFNSFGVAFGSMISFASYNRYNNNILHDTLAVSFVNAVTSLLVGIFAFAVIGNIATEQNTSIEDVISDGPGLIFVVYPQAIAKMPASQLWAVLFFFMLLCLGLNSQFAIVEVVVTSIQDGFPGWIKKKLVCHEMLVLIVCVVSFLFGLPNVTKGGIYFFQLMDHYAASISIMYLAFFEVIAIAWFYGVWRLSKNIENMNAKTPSLYFKFCWMIAAPLFIMALWIFCLIDYESPTYNNGEYRYPVWAIVLGWIISSLSIACIPLFAIYVFIKAEGETYREKLRNSLMPDLEECKICGDHNCEHMEEEQELQEISPMLILKLDSGDASRTDIQTNNGAIIQPVNPKA